jgi:hypothetical protein
LFFSYPYSGKWRLLGRLSDSYDLDLIVIQGDKTGCKAISVCRPRPNFRSNRKHRLAGKARFLSKNAEYSADVPIANWLAWSSVTVVFSPGARADPELAPEDSGKGRLIRETRLQRDVNKRDAGSEQ